MKDKLICIDPGHGGLDSGAVGPNGPRESDVNLRVGWLLRVELALRDMPMVYMTRQRDEFVRLMTRCDFANASPQNVCFVSLHCNCGPEVPPDADGYCWDKRAHGFEVYHYPGSAKGIGLATRIQDAVERAKIVTRIECHSTSRGVSEKLFCPTDPERITNMEYHYLTMRGDRGGPKADGRLAVLRHTKMPAVLVEMAFISNPDEEALLVSDAGQLAFARAIADGTQAYLTR